MHLKQIITTPLFYVNSKPHIGHLYSMIYADAIRSYRKCQLLTGTDEHGLKVYKSAHGNNIQGYCDKISNQFRQLADTHIKYDNFVRTTDQHHIEKVRNIWKQLDIYKSAYKGYYCTREEAFVTHKTDNYVEEDNYFFKLDQQLVQQFIENVNEQYRGELKALKIQDICVSRPKQRQMWGIDIDDQSMVYVWIDALCGYLQDQPMHYRHVIGKDILRFHAIYWPSMLKAMNNTSQVDLIIHNHWIKDNIKMSKSLNNVIDPIVLQKQYTKNQIRLYFLTQGPQNHDVNFDEAVLKKTWNEYIDKFNNLLCRLVTPKFCKPNQLILNLDQLDSIQQEVQLKYNILTDNYEKHMQNSKLIEAYEELRKIFKILNEILVQQAPWNENDKIKKEQILAFIFYLLHDIQIKLEPFVEQRTIFSIQDKGNQKLITVDLVSDLFLKKFIN